MNRVDRLFALTLELHGDGWTTGEALARHFGVSLRTVYRDLSALNEAGVPVLSSPGRGFQLLPGYLLAPLHFTPPEALMLGLGLDTVRVLFDGEYARAADSARRKLEATLPAGRTPEVRHLQDLLRVLPPGPEAAPEMLGELRRAVLERRTVGFTYHKVGHKAGHSPEQRRVYPLRLIHLHGHWVLGAHDPARGARRTFRLSRMEALRVLPETFGPTDVGPAPADPRHERRDLTVRLRFPARLARAVHERPSPFTTVERPLRGGLEVTLQVYVLKDALPWVLSWGAGVRVLEPRELAEQLRSEARRMLAQRS